MSTGRELLETARAEHRGGSVRSAWAAVTAAAAVARQTGDADLLADAALVISEPVVGAWDFAAQRHALCREALRMLGGSDGDGASHGDTEARAERLRTLLVVTRSPWQTQGPSSASWSGSAEARSRELHARHAAAVGAAGVHTRLACADALADLAAARSTGGGGGGGRREDAAWASLWRLDAYAQLARRLELNAELMALVAHVRELGSPVWRWRLAAARTSLALLEGHVDDVAAMVEETLRAGTDAGVEDAPFLALVMRSSLAVQTRTGLEAVEPQVRRVIADGPFLAQGWRAEVLLAQGRTGEAAATWRALVPLLPDLPTAPPSVTPRRRRTSPSSSHPSQTSTPPAGS